MVGTTWIAECARRVGLVRAWRVGLCAALCLPVLSCGGGAGGSGGSTSSGGSTGGTTPTPSNVVSVIVDVGPTSTQPDVNTLFTTVTVCIPGTTTCQTIDHIQVDTGSYGLRILAPVLTLSLPIQQASNGDSLVECTEFVAAYSWGPVALADVQIAGETASSVPVQVIGDANFTNVPAWVRACLRQRRKTPSPPSAPMGYWESAFLRRTAAPVARARRTTAFTTPATRRYATPRPWRSRIRCRTR